MANFKSDVLVQPAGGHARASRTSSRLTTLSTLSKLIALNSCCVLLAWTSVASSAPLDATDPASADATPTADSPTPAAEQDSSGEPSRSAATPPDGATEEATAREHASAHDAGPASPPPTQAVPVDAANTVAPTSAGTTHNPPPPTPPDPIATPSPDPAIARGITLKGPAELVLEFKARVMTGWEYQHEHPQNGQPGEDETDFGLFLDQVRLGLDAKLKKLLRLQVDFELSSANDPPAGVRDAWLNVRFAKPLQLRIGRLKRPFSRLELKGASELPVRGRGLGNELLVEDMGYAERALTGQLHGRIGVLDLNWAISVSNPPPNQRGADLHARLEVDATKWLEFGGAIAHKIIDDPATLEDDFIAGSGYNVDARVRLEGLYLILDGVMAEDLRFDSRPWAGALAGYASYDMPLTKRWSLQPVIFGEWADSDLEFSRSEAVRFIAGLNGIWFEGHLRVMPQVELVRPLEANEDTIWEAREAFYVMLAGQI